jgi:hypothetical protein
VLNPGHGGVAFSDIRSDPSHPGALVAIRLASTRGPPRIRSSPGRCPRPICQAPEPGHERRR